MPRWSTFRPNWPQAIAGVLGVGVLGLTGLALTRPVPQGSATAHQASEAPPHSSPTSSPTSSPANSLAGPRYSTRNLGQAVAHIVTVPPTDTVTVAIASTPDGGPDAIGLDTVGPDAIGPGTVGPDATGLDTVTAIARARGAIAALNAGFFDPQNGQTTAYITIDGELVADPRSNRRLMENPDLLPYRDQILNRSEFRRYRCDDPVSQNRYAIASHSAPPPTGCQIVDAVGGGPRLLPELTSAAEGFVAEVDGVRVRDALGETQPNARSAVGITPEGAVLLVAIEQRPSSAEEEDSRGAGLSLPDLTELMRTLGAESALNLDGGSSTALYYRGRTYTGRWTEGAPVERPVKSVLLVID